MHADHGVNTLQRMAVPANPDSIPPVPGPLLRLGAHSVTGWPATLLSLLAGATLVLAFAPFDHYLLAPLSLALWFALLRGAGPRHALRHGYAFGLGLFGAGANWIFNSLLIFGEAPLVVATLITALFVLYLALYPALLAWIAARLFGRARLLSWLLALAGGFVLLEALRGWFLSGFPWLLIGHTLLDSPARGWLPVAGEAGAGLVVALAAVALVLLGARRFVAGLVLLAMLLASSAGNALWNGLQPAPSALRVAIVQGNIEQSRKWADDGIDYALSLYSGLSREAGDVDLLVWPETAIPAFYFEVYEPLEVLSLDLEAWGTELVTGIFDYDPATRAMYNSIRHIPSGATYDKRQLVPFGEFLPFRDRVAWLDRLLDIPMSDLTPGTGSGRVAMAGLVAGLSVCYEAAYSRRIRAALPEAGFLLNVSNDAWFGDTLAPHQHLQIARVRALEMGRPLIRATNTGVSALIDADGRLTARAGLFTREVLTGEIQPRQGYTPAARFGPWPALLVALLLVLPAGRARRGRAA
ncbi:Apolipoprotein N-acyltransferase / Copper homeostasis protein CutE [Thioalkalivibrio nitratireducens DSM 14787]|uniref:Apolipoprotein N-acyltransferase n=1 Tax=Thioalkalivibrio nitratireducens (strain DSM 14787 / UNIQEM 213 / ALEN2) TaxID=1255043 RepID=L0E0L0_THIND|nr:apolipoprotein N-acyltransferase [Thioalkalivibrio nitratireducens]AGA34181.1 Apolipoprotein N-acyltransferase / Copper homeostasis protein CutE [Thioalkalivibrio nitratireducens DSM 14787]